MPTITSNDNGAAADPHHADNRYHVEVNYEYQSAIRFPAWIGLAVFSGICLAAAASELDKSDRGSQEAWTLAVCSISLSIAFFAALGYIFVRGIFMGTPKIEGVMILIILGFWGFGLPTIMGPDNDIAVSGGAVKNANLYFGAWVSFAICVFLALSILQESFGIDARTAPSKQAKWFFLMASSAVVLGSATRIHKAESTGCTEDAFSDTSYCKRTSFAIALGVISCLASIAMVFLTFRNMVPTVVEMGVLLLLVILWCFGVGFITFGGTSSPGTTIGNLYFSTWISFIICIMLFAAALAEFFGMAASTNTPPSSSQQDPSSTSMPDHTVDPEEEYHNKNGHAPAVPGEEDF